MGVVATIFLPRHGCLDVSPLLPTSVIAPVALPCRQSARAHHCALGVFATPTAARRVALEGLSHNASCTSCQQDRRTEHEVVPHLRLELTHPKPQTIFLYGNVTPLECAAAHGHVPVMKQLMQVKRQEGLAAAVIAGIQCRLLSEVVI